MAAARAWEKLRNSHHSIEVAKARAKEAKVRAKAKVSGDLHLPMTETMLMSQ